MAVIYESRRFPVAFQTRDIGGRLSYVRNTDNNNGSPAYPLLSGPRNGSLATSGAITSIIDNTHWLAMGDPPMINFFEVWANGDNNPAGRSWSGSASIPAKTIKVLVPPFCRWASFHFLCSHNFGGNPTENHHIKVASAFHTTINPNIPFGEDTSASGKPDVAYYSADWIHFQGIDTTEPQSPVAVRLFEDATEHATWEWVDVTITPSASVNIYAAAYRVLPAMGIMQVQT